MSLTISSNSLREVIKMKCPNCEKDNTEEETYCEDCGAELKVSSNEEIIEDTSVKDAKENQELFGRYRVINSQNWGKGIRNIALDLSRDEKEVIIFEKSITADMEIDSESLKIQWDLIKDAKDSRFPALIDFIHENDRLYLVSEFLDFESVDEIIRKGKAISDQETVIKWGISICDTIGLMHEKKILHRDIQPINLFLMPENEILVSGFDRICFIDNVPKECEVTAGYSAPEAYGIGERKIDERSDIYSIGASLYFTIAGRTPELEQRENFFSFPHFSFYNLSINADLESVIMKSVSKNPEERYNSVIELKEALKAVNVNETKTIAAKESRALTINVGMKTNVGKVREINQDSCISMNFTAYEKSELIEAGLFIVADGMGGEAEGEKASSLAIRAISRYVLDSYLSPDISVKTRRLLPDNVMEKCKCIISEALKEANRIVFDYAKQNISRKGMGSTISAALIEGNNLIIGHAGDTRVYLINEDIEQISEDHSLVGRLVKIGQLKKEEALKSPQRSLVYRALGTNPELEVDNYNRELKAGDYILLCSDGVWEYFLDDELLKIIKENLEPQSICEKLVDLCLERGADDNCTAIVMRMDEV